MSVDKTDSEFWAWSVRTYAGPGVKEACLSLQSQGLDVNIALWLAWVIHKGRDPRPTLGQAIDLSAAWSDQIVKPLRATRDRLKAMAGKGDPDIIRLRRQVLDTELEAERIQQLRVEPLLSQCPPLKEQKKQMLGDVLAVYAERMSAPTNTVNFAETIFSHVE